jgi:hypothetical protein
MKNYIVYITTTGQIVRFGSCSENDYNLQAQDGESTLEGVVNSDSYIENGIVTPIPPKPFPFYLFNYDTKQWYDPRTNETQRLLVRSQRKELLLESDWTQLPDVPLATKEAWATYRQALRDITTQTDPFNITWPVKPL